MRGIICHTGGTSLMALGCNPPNQPGVYPSRNDIIHGHIHIYIYTHGYVDTNTNTATDSRDTAMYRTVHLCIDAMHSYSQIIRLLSQPAPQPRLLAVKKLHGLQQTGFFQPSLSCLFLADHRKYLAFLVD